MKLTSIIFGITFMIVGLLFAKGKIHVHTKPWRNMTSLEQSAINIKPLQRNIGQMIIINGIIFLLNGVWSNFKENWFIYAVLAWFFVAIIDIYYIDKSQRYRK